MVVTSGAGAVSEPCLAPVSPMDIVPSVTPLATPLPPLTSSMPSSPSSPSSPPQPSPSTTPKKHVHFATESPEVDVFRRNRRECRRVFQKLMDHPIRFSLSKQDVQDMTQPLEDKELLAVYANRVLDALSTTSEITWRQPDDSLPRKGSTVRRTPVVTVRYCPVAKTRASVLIDVVCSSSTPSPSLSPSPSPTPSPFPSSSMQ